MKWGKVLRQGRLWKWRTRYISYKALKHIIREINTTYENSTENTSQAPLNINNNASVNKFFQILNTDLHKVETFYCHKKQQLMQQSTLLLTQHSKQVQYKTSVSKNNKQNGNVNININVNGDIKSENKRANNNNHSWFCLTRGLRRLLTQFYELKEYCFLNREGFRKILKKFDKKLSKIFNFNNNYNKTIEYLPLIKKSTFYNHNEILDTISQIESILKTDSETHTPQENIINQLINEVCCCWNKRNFCVIFFCILVIMTNFILHCLCICVVVESSLYGGFWRFGSSDC